MSVESDVKAMIAVLKDREFHGPYLARNQQGEWFEVQEDGTIVEVEIDCDHAEYLSSKGPDMEKVMCDD